LPERNMVLASTWLPCMDADTSGTQSELHAQWPDRCPAPQPAATSRYSFHSWSAWSSNNHLCYPSYRRYPRSLHSGVCFPAKQKDPLQQPNMAATGTWLEQPVDPRPNAGG